MKGFDKSFNKGYEKYPQTTHNKCIWLNKKDSAFA